MSHSAENPKESSMLAKHVVSSKSREGFDENQFRKSHIVPKKDGIFVLFCKCTKKFLAEAGTRTRDRWVPAKPITLRTK